MICQTFPYQTFLLYGIRIANSKNPILLNYTIQNTIIQSVSNVTYLGVIINEHLSRSNHVRSKHYKENKCYYIILETLYRETSTYAHLQ